ncbi:MAG: serine/threonine-protein kinase [Verrucomicrobiota bacterium]|nr:serine/threonine-protein kinase [Verrucomicrobiota bacterium]
MAKQIKDLKIIRHFAQGGLSTLYLAVDKENRQVLIRRLLPKHIFNKKMHWCFFRGIRLRSKLPFNDYIVFSYEWGYSGITPYEIIEYIDGPNLQALIHKQDEILNSHRIELLIEIATAIEFLHKQGIIHLDIKAENFLLTEKSITDNLFCIKLTDFDLSRKFYGKKILAGNGSVSYISPEQLLGKPVGPLSDMFSFGVLAYYLLSGHKPFPADTLKEVKKKRLRKERKIVSLNHRVPNLPYELIDLVMKCLERNPKKRYPRMAYIIKELQEINL